MVTVTCAGCGRQFEARRRDARTCSASCRKRAQRAAHRAVDDATTEHLRRDRDRKRASRAADRAEAAASRPAAPDQPNSLIEFCSGLEVSQGDHEGDLLTVLGWQAAVLRVVEEMTAGRPRPPGGEYGLSLPAGSGKTTLIAAIAAAALVWEPMVRRRADVLVVAGSFSQARICFDTAAEFLSSWTDADPDRWRVLRSEQSALVEDRETGAKLRAREANARTLHGAAPSLVIADEPSQWMPSQRDQIYSALRSRLGKIPGAALLGIGTLPADSSHWFCRLLERNGMTYQADVDDDPFLPSTWAQANPSLPHFPALRAVYQREADEAAADPSLLPSFAALRLNLGTADHQQHVLIEAAAWVRCEVDILPAATGGAVWGVDLSGGDALAAISSYWPTTGRLEAMAAFPELPDLAERGKRDGADYERMHADGDLLVIGRRVVPVAGLIGAALERWGRPARIVADHHQARELREALEAVQFPLAELALTGMGWRDSPGRVRDFRRAVLAGRVFVQKRLLIRQALANMRTERNSMLDEKPIKGGAVGRKRTARDDVAMGYRKSGCAAGRV